jgi:hypothetical protein
LPINGKNKKITETNISKWIQPLSHCKPY